MLIHVQMHLKAHVCVHAHSHTKQVCPLIYLYPPLLPNGTEDGLHELTTWTLSPCPGTIHNYNMECNKQILDAQGATRDQGISLRPLSMAALWGSQQGGGQQEVSTVTKKIDLGP